MSSSMLIAGTGQLECPPSNIRSQYHPMSLYLVLSFLEEYFGVRAWRLGEGEGFVTDSFRLFLARQWI